MGEHFLGYSCYCDRSNCSPEFVYHNKTVVYPIFYFARENQYSFIAFW